MSLGNHDKMARHFARQVKEMVFGQFKGAQILSSSSPLDAVDRVSINVEKEAKLPAARAK